MIDYYCQLCGKVEQLTQGPHMAPVCCGMIMSFLGDPDSGDVTKEPPANPFYDQKHGREWEW